MSFTQKFKPACFSDLIFDNTTTATSLLQYASCKSNDNLILFGTYGTGKTTTAAIIQLERFQHQKISPNTLSIDATSWEKTTKATITNWWSYQLAKGANVPTVVIDEIDQLSKTDQLSLRSFLDKYNEIGNAVMTTNFLSSVDGGLINRCTSIEIPLAAKSLWLPRVQSYLRQLAIQLPDTSIQQVIDATDGTIRGIGRAVDNLVIAQQQT